MKIFPSIALLAMSVVFLSCSNGVNHVSGCALAAAKPSYEELDPICNSEQRRLVHVHDPYDVGANVYSIDSLERSLIMATTPEEVDAIKKDFYERDRLYREYLVSIRTTIPCVVDAEGLVRSALLTDGEIAELRKTYYIDDPQEYKYVELDQEFGGHTEYEPDQGCY